MCIGLRGRNQQKTKDNNKDNKEEDKLFKTRIKDTRSEKKKRESLKNQDELLHAFITFYAYNYNLCHTPGKKRKMRIQDKFFAT